jgi:hypothetical protein
MQSLAELFNPTFFLFLGILVLVVALMVLYYESKMRDQNHKIASMLSLVSTLAEDMNIVKMGLNHVAMGQGQVGGSQQIERPLENNVNVQKNTHLITVSDDEDDSDDDAEDDEEESVSDDEESVDDDEESVSDDDDSDDEESVEDAEPYENIGFKSKSFDYNSDGIIYNNDFNNVKILKLNIFNSDEPNTETKYEAHSKIEEIDENSLSVSDEIDNLGDENIDELEESSLSELPDDLLDEIEEMDSDNKNVANEERSDVVNTSLNLSSNDFKRIAINLGEDVEPEHIDYKKLQLPKLRSIVVEKGLTTNSEAAKLKKQDLLKMLETE